MKLLTDPDRFIEMMDWAEKTVSQSGAPGGRRLQDVIDKKIKEGRARNRRASEVEELEEMSFCLSKALSDRWLKDSMTPGMEAVKRVKKHGQTQSEKRQKRQTWKGLNPEQRAARNKKMVEHFKKTGLSKRSFAERHAAKYGLKISQIRSILPV
jgi:hypothetical protein